MDKKIKMMKKCHNCIIYPLLILFVAWFFSCSGRSNKKEVENEPVKELSEPEEMAAEMIKLVAPPENAELKLNEKIKIVLEPDARVLPDSVRIWFDGKDAGVIRNNIWEYEIPSSFNSKTGKKAIKVVAYKRRYRSQTISRFVTVLSDVAPRRNGYRVINVYPHDREAFTQGLVYYGGYLYEGTGQETRSNLRKVNLATGEVLNQHNLDSKLFGEGIAIFDGKIYQLTWQSKVGFVYDLESFRMINRFYYQTEGWGLTTMGDKLVMSDGSNILYIIDPAMFLPVAQLEVYDNKSMVKDLNELEYIKGEIWANIWMTDLIARIDPASGKVLAYIDLKGIMNDPSFDTASNVLNGIAYDSENDRIFITGKNWPKLFEIKVTE
ncbi:MAG: glutaminyl-peptide cyclotransferase [Bacteroidales bacterium]